MTIEVRAFQFRNNARSTLLNAISASSTSITLQLLAGEAFPTLSTGQIFSLIVWSTDLTTYEVMYCTAKTGDTLTVERGKEGTIARSFAAGAVVVHNVTAGFLSQLVGPQPSTPVLSLDSAATQHIDLSWTASIPVAPSTIVGYKIWRRVDTGAYLLLATVSGSTLSYSDAAIDREAHSYHYYVVADQIVGRDSAPSNVVTVNALPSVAFVLSSNGSDIYRSLDLVTWNTIALGTSGVWVGGAYSLSLNRIVIVKNSGVERTAYSDDGGLTWTPHTGLPDFSYTGIAWSEPLGLFCVTAVNSGGVARIYTSPDGLTWTLHNSGARDITYSAVVWHGASALFVACGNASPVDHDGGLTSPDGINWTVRTIDDGGWGHATDLAVAGSRVFGFGTASNTMNYSDDGINWFGGTGPLGGVNGFAAKPDLSQHVRVRSSNNAVEYSATFNSGYTLVDQGQIYRDVGYDERLSSFLAAGDNEVATSSDGVTWANPTFPAVLVGPVFFAKVLA